MELNIPPHAKHTDKKKADAEYICTGLNTA